MVYEELLLLLARGGGGSSGGSSGGGGGVVFYFIGYLPSYFLAKIVKKLLPRKAELIVSCTFATIVSMVLAAMAIMMNEFRMYLYISVIITGIWSGWISVFFGIWDKLLKKSKRAKLDITQAELADGSVWNHQNLTQRAEQVFMQYQRDWSNGDIAAIQAYTTPHYYDHARLLLQALHQLQRQNKMTEVKIKQSLVFEAFNNADNTLDTFSIAFEASAKDQMIDSRSNAVLFEDKSKFTEMWHFIRDGQAWKLNGITQATQNKLKQNDSLKDFAKTNKMYYSLDMGWLLVPVKGVLAEQNYPGRSDVNNHIIGTYKGNLVQLYTLTTPQNFTSIIMQIALPKEYGGILVRPKPKSWLSKLGYVRPPKGYQKHTFEWGDFNDRYEVSATDADRLASFELINPGFMAYLYDNDPGVSIEVADNILYLHISNSFSRRINNPETKTKAYSTMLEISLRAFKELKL